MKAGIAVAMAVLQGLAETRAGDATLLLVPDEEVGSGASRALTVALARRHRAVLVLEPSDDGAAKVARKGNGLFRIVFRGRAAHAGLEPERGASALAELARCVLFLETLGDAFGRHFGRPEPGAQRRPNQRRAGGRRALRGRARLDAAGVASVSRPRSAAIGPRIPESRSTVEGGFDRPPLEPTPESEALFERARETAGALGLELRAARVGGASDGNLTAAAGVPTLDGLGPEGGGAHARHEFVRLTDLPRRAALVAALVASASGR